MVKTQFDVQPVKSDGKQRKKNAVVNNNFEADESVDNDHRPPVESAQKPVDQVGTE